MVHSGWELDPKDDVVEGETMATQIVGDVNVCLSRQRGVGEETTISNRGEYAPPQNMISIVHWLGELGYRDGA